MVTFYLTTEVTTSCAYYPQAVYTLFIMQLLLGPQSTCSVTNWYRPTNPQMCGYTFLYSFWKKGFGPGVTITSHCNEVQA